MSSRKTYRASFVCIEIPGKYVFGCIQLIFVSRGQEKKYLLISAFFLFQKWGNEISWVEMCCLCFLSTENVAALLSSSFVFIFQASNLIRNEMVLNVILYTPLNPNSCQNVSMLWENIRNLLKTSLKGHKRKKDCDVIFLFWWDVLVFRIHCDHISFCVMLNSY